ncbi:MAG: DUF3243 domain-containing protein [Halanaerobiales bacterium]
MVEQFTEWDKWKKTLGQAINIGHKIGLKDETIITIGSKIGDFLDWNTDPENREQRVIKEMWDQADEEEQKTLTKLLVKMISSEEKIKEKAH